MLKSPLVGSVHETLDRLDCRTRILRLKSPLVGSVHETRRDRDERVFHPNVEKPARGLGSRDEVITSHEQAAHFWLKSPLVGSIRETR